MSNKTYSGWTNRATWLVNVWYEPQSTSELEYAKYDIYERFDDMENSILKDLIDLDEINWQELMDCFEDDDTEEDED